MRRVRGQERDINLRCQQGEQQAQTTGLKEPPPAQQPSSKSSDLIEAESKRLLQGSAKWGFKGSLVPQSKFTCYLGPWQRLCPGVDRKGLC